MFIDVEQLKTTRQEIAAKKAVTNQITLSPLNIFFNCIYNIYKLYTHSLNILPLSSKFSYISKLEHAGDNKIVFP